MYPTLSRSSPRPDARPMLSRLELIPGKRLPDAQVERAFLAETLEDAQGPEPAVLVVDRDDRGERQRDPSRQASPSRPPSAGRRCPGNARRTPRRRTPVGSPSSLRSTTPPGTQACRRRASERRRVEPQRVVVLRHERDGHLARYRVERLLVGSPAGDHSSPPEAPQPASARNVGDRRGDAGERLVEQAGPLEPHLALRQDQVGKWTCESVKPGTTHLPPRSMRSGLARAVSCVPAARDALARYRQRGRLRERGPSVRTTPFSRITPRG